MAKTRNQKNKEQKRKIGWYPKLLLILLGIFAVFNAIIWVSKGFCDWYVRKVFPLAVNTIGRFSDMIPFNFGDMLLIMVVVLFFMGILMLVMSPFFRERIWPVTKRFWKFLIVFVLVILIELSMNWWVLYHTTSIRDKEIPEGREYTNVEFARLYNYVVDNLNDLVDRVARDENGVPYCEIDINEESIKLVKSMEIMYPELGGYYPQPKGMSFSDFFSQRYIGGYYFPVTMESNINTNMAEINFPFTTCHELSHLKGIIREDEANYIGILACMSSSDVFFRYSGYMTAFNYLADELPEVPDYMEILHVNPRVYDDSVFIPQETWDRIEDEAILDTDFIKDVSDVILDTSLNMNGIEEGIESYNEVNTLLLHYFLDR